MTGASASDAEVTLKAVSAFHKAHARTVVFLDFIKLLNKEAAGVKKIEFLGGPEITPPSKQPLVLRNGLFDLQYGPPAYYLGMLPEGDALDGLKLPAESRKVGGFKYFDKALRAKIGATFISRFDAGSGIVPVSEGKTASFKRWFARSGGTQSPGFSRL